MFGIGQSLRRKPRQFSYNPRYYDPEEEARNQRRIELGHKPIERGEKGEKEYKPGDLLRARSQYRMEKVERDLATRRRSNITRLIFVVLLALGFWMLLKNIGF